MNPSIRSFRTFTQLAALAAIAGIAGCHHKIGRRTGACPAGGDCACAHRHAHG